VELVGFRMLAYAAVAAHYAFLATGVFGGFPAWRRPRLLALHLPAVAWMALTAVLHLPCPLTWVEDRARERAGMAAQPGGFLANDVAGVFYPHGHDRAAMAVVAAVVLFSWAGLVIRLRAGARPPRPRAGSRWRSRRSSPGPVAPR
jgi:Protein of Unknown function (DUF2784)